MLRKLSAVLVFALASCSRRRSRQRTRPKPRQRREGAASAEAADDAADDEAADPDDADAESGYDGDAATTGMAVRRHSMRASNFDHGSSGDSGFAQIRAGYHFLRFAALEAQLEYTPKFNGDSGSYAGVNTAIFGAWANIKGYPTAPWTGRFQPYAMIGLGWWWERRWGSAVNGVDQNGGFVSRFGGGIDFYVTKNIVVTAESAWVLPTGHLEPEAGPNRRGASIPLRSRDP